MSKAALATEPFVPFGPGTAAGVKSAGAATNLKVVPKDAAASFSPFQPTPGAHAHGVASGGSGEPTVTLQKEGDKIVGIRVECACGQVIELACSY
jgi:hypothetical protein